MPKTKRLTKKEREFYKKYFKIGNGTKAALYAYDTDDEAVAAQIAYENLRKPKIINAINTLMDKEGLTDKKLMKVLQEGLKAVRKDHKIVGRDEKNKPVYDFVDVADFPTRQRYLKLAFELKEILNKKTDINIDKSKHFHFTKKERKERVNRLEEYYQKEPK